jgi:hypothetical protein
VFFVDFDFNFFSESVYGIFGESWANCCGGNTQIHIMTADGLEETNLSLIMANAETNRSKPEKRKKM